MFFAFDFFFNFHVEQRVTTGHFRIPVQQDAPGAQQLGAIQTLGGRFSVLPVDQLADITERILGRFLATDDFRQTRDQEVIGQLSNSSHRELSSLPAERTREFSIVAIFLIRRFGVHVGFDTLGAESVQAIEAFGIFIPLQAYFADEEFIVDFLSESVARG